jgi:DNA-binding MarR family transcriptional regulator
MLLTKKEKLAWNAAVESSDGNGHDFGYTEDIVEDLKAHGIGAQAAGALISSLEKKGLFYVHEAVTTDSGRWTQLTLTEEGLALAEAKEPEEKQEQPKEAVSVPQDRVIVISKDIPNPAADRRVKRSWSAKPVIEAETKLRIEFERINEDLLPKNVQQYVIHILDMNGYRSSAVSGTLAIADNGGVDVQFGKSKSKQLAKLIWEQDSENVAEQTAKLSMDLLFDVGRVVQSSYMKSILAKLVDQGKVTVEDVEAAMEAVHAE